MEKKLLEALIICVSALRELTSNDNVYDDTNGDVISFDALDKLIEEAR